MNALRAFSFFALFLSSMTLQAQTPAPERPPFPPEFSFRAQDLLDLTSGKIVLQSNPDGYLGGIAFAVLEAPSWKVWQVITDYPKYPDFFPRNLKTLVRRQEGDEIFLRSEYQGSVVQPVIWSESHVHHDTKDPKNLRMTWSALETNLKVNFGYWQLIAWKEKTLVVYRADFDFFWIPNLLASPLAREALRTNLQAIVNRLQDARYNKKPGQIALAWQDELPALANPR